MNSIAFLLKSCIDLFQIFIFVIMSAFDYVDAKNPTANDPDGNAWNHVIGLDIEYASINGCTTDQWEAQEAYILTLPEVRRDLCADWMLAFLRSVQKIKMLRHEKEDKQYMRDIEIESLKKQLYLSHTQIALEGPDTAESREKKRKAALAMSTPAAPAILTSGTNEAARELIEELRERERESRGMGWTQLQTKDHQSIQVERATKMIVIEAMTIWLRLMKLSRFLEYSVDKMSFSVEKMLEVLEEKKSRISNVFFVAMDNEWRALLLLDEAKKNPVMMDRTLFERVCCFDYKFNQLSHLCYPQCYPYGIDNFNPGDRNHQPRPYRRYSLFYA